MKKSVSLIVFAISLITIVFVAIFGTKPQGIVPKIYMEKITIKTSDDSEYDAENSKMVLKYDVEQEVQYDGEYYMPYIFMTSVLPENATDRSFIYYFDDSYRSYIDFPMGNDTAKYQGAFLIKKQTAKQYKIVKLFCKPLDGGKAPVASMTVILDYSSVFSK